MAAQPDTLGHYKIQGVRGKGAMGVVYEALDPRLNRRVAIKAIQRTDFGNWSASEYSARFLREAQAVARLNHPNIVQVYDFGEDNNVSFIVMEFIDGEDLKTHFEDKARFDLRESLRIMSELLDALDFAHSAGVVHRDIKPANVMLDRQRRAKLTDFGVARLTDHERSQMEATQVGTIVGTPAYMSPEQVLGLKVDGRSDIFSAGVLLYEFVTGKKPFEGGAFTLAKMITETDPPAPSSIQRSLSPELDRIISRTMAKAPENRFATAAEASTALKRFLASGAVLNFDEGSTVLAPGAFVRGMGTPSRKLEEPTRPPVTAQAPARDSEAEVEFWRSIKDSDDPEDLELYVAKFPDGIYVDLAKRKMGKLRSRTGPRSEEDSGIRSGRFDEEYWRSIKDSDEPDDLELYLSKFPDGAFADLARHKLGKVRRGIVDTGGSGARSVVGAAGAMSQIELARAEAARKAAEEKANREAQEEVERREAAELAQRQAAEQAEREERAKAEAAKKEAEERAAREARAKARLEAEEKARRDAEEEQARRDSAKKEAEEKAAREALAKAKLEAEEKAKREAEAERTRREAARKEAEEKAAREAVAKAKVEAEEKAKREAAAAQARRLEAELAAREERAKAEAAKKEAEERAAREAKARREAEERKAREEEQARKEAELAKAAAARKAADEKAARDAQAKRDAEAKAKRDAEEQQAKRDAEAKALRDRELAKQQAQERARVAAQQAARPAEAKDTNASALPPRPHPNEGQGDEKGSSSKRGSRVAVAVVATMAVVSFGTYYALKNSPANVTGSPSAPSSQPVATGKPVPASPAATSPSSPNASIPAANPAPERPAEAAPPPVHSAQEAPAPVRPAAKVDDRAKRDADRARREAADKAEAQAASEKARRDAEQRQAMEAQRTQAERAEREAAEQRQRAEAARREADESRKSREELQRVQAELRAKNEELARQKAEAEKKGEAEKPKPRVSIPPSM